MAEPTSIPGYSGHYFILDAESQETVSFTRGTEEPFLLQIRMPEFELAGDGRIETSDDLGPLFVAQPPRICARHSDQWQLIKTIVIGREGGGRAKWRTEFKPLPEATEQQLPPIDRVTRGGWFFLRLYDRNDELLDSLNFRYLRDVTRIYVDAVPPLPGPEGHKETTIHFDHLAGCQVEPARLESRIVVEGCATGSLARIPPHPSLDHTNWEVPITPRRKVEFSLLIERVWWAIDDDSAESRQTEWTDRPIQTEKENFLPTSTKILRLWFPKPGWVREVYVGFERSRRWRHAVRPGERSIAIALRDFSDTTEVSEWKDQFELRLWLYRDGTEMQAILIHRAPVTARPRSTPGPVVDRSRTNCTGCDHAKTRFGFVGCKRHHWNWMCMDVFNQHYSGHWCAEWTGEDAEEQGQ